MNKDDNSPGSILDSLTISDTPLPTPTVKRSSVRSNRTKCRHGYDTTYDRMDMVAALPSNIFANMLLPLEPTECFMEVYKEEIDKWEKDKIPCRGACFKYVIRGINEYANGGYWCDNCFRRRSV